MTTNILKLVDTQNKITLIGGLSLQVIVWVSCLLKLKGLLSSLSRELVKSFSMSIAQKHKFFSFPFSALSSSRFIMLDAVK